MREAMQLLGELWRFLMREKKWWLAPIVIALVVLGALAIMTEGSAFAPLIYTIF